MGLTNTQSTSRKTSANYELDQCGDRSIGARTPLKDMHIWYFPLAAENCGPRPITLYPNPRCNGVWNNEARLYKAIHRHELPDLMVKVDCFDDFNKRTHSYIKPTMHVI